MPAAAGALDGMAPAGWRYDRRMPRPRLYGSNAERQRAYRARKRPPPPPLKRPPLGTSARTLAKWVRSTLKVPAGHPRAGQPFRIAGWQLAVLSDCLTHHEVLLSVARKNGKSALVAIYVLAHLAGPMRCGGWRCGVLSINRAKAGELLDQIEQIADASNLSGLTFRRSPRRILSETGAVDIESADRGAGAASGFDSAIIDELGLLAERDRPLVAGMRSSVSAKDGRFIALSVHGDGPFIPEIIERRGERGLAVHLYQADPDLPVDSPAAWRQSNPGLGTVKATAYMRRESRRVLVSTSDQPSFCALDLNAPGAPAAELVCTPDQWRRCEVPVESLPPRDGPVVVGIDLGMDQSFTSAGLFWPATGRFEIRTACPDRPALAKRAKRDGAGAVYERAVERGDLWPLSGIVTPVPGFLSRLAGDLAGCRVAAVGCDRFRHHELVRVLGDLGLPWRPVWRGSGIRSGENMDADCRAFQRGVATGAIRTPRNLMMAYSLSQAKVVRDGQGHAQHLKGIRQRARIDPVQASVIAAGLGESFKGRKSTGKVWVA